MTHARVTISSLFAHPNRLGVRRGIVRRRKASVRERRSLCATADAAKGSQ